MTHLGNTILTSIKSVGYLWFAVMVIIDIILYRIHPILGFLGTLFLFALITGLIH